MNVSSLECPPAEGAPTLAGEFRRGINPFNLGFGAVAAFVLGMAPGLYLGSWQVSLALIVGLFVALTFLHTVAHALMGWIFERGLKLHCQGDFESARRWLFLAEKPGMDHYDPNGHARKALRDCQRKQ